MVMAIAKILTLAAPKALRRRPECPYPLQTNFGQCIHHLPLLPSVLTSPISYKSVTRRSGNASIFHVKCSIRCSNSTCNQTGTTQIDKNAMQKLPESYGSENEEETLQWLGTSGLSAVLALVPLLVDAEAAFAIDGEFGLLEGRSASLIHPIVMGSLFFFTLWTGYLGWQWRRVRTIQEEINELKRQVKPQPKEEGNVPAPPSPVETKIQQLTEERKALLKGSYRDRHYNAGSILLGFGVFEAIGGCLNTWFRTGKLFPGPHLFAGAGITVLWALAAALVPEMQRGNDTARNLHIALNAVNVLLFIWQIPTGIDIVLKVLEFTNWP